MVRANEMMKRNKHQRPVCLELDQSLLTASKRQKFSSVKMRQGCRESYRYFLDLVGV